MKKIILATLFTLAASSSFASTLVCTNYSTQPNHFTVVCGTTTCLLNSTPDGSSTGVNIPLTMVSATRTTVTFENTQANLGVIVTKRSSNLSTAFFARVYVNRQLTSYCQ